MMRRLWRRLRARQRFYALLVREFRIALLAFVVIALLSGMAIVQFHPAARGHSLVEGVYSAIGLMFLQASLPFPQDGPVQALYFLLPFLGITLLAEQVVRFCILVFNKENRLEDWYVALASTHSEHFVVCGLGAVGYRVVCYLERLGKDIVAVELNPQGSFVEKVRDRGIPVLIGDPRREELMRQVGIERAQAVLAVTNDDLANLEIALDARQLNPAIRVVLRMFDDVLAAKVRKAFNIQVAFSSSALAGPAFAAASTSSAVRQSYTVKDDIYHVAELPVAAGLDGKTVGEVEKRFPCSVLAIMKETAQSVFPAADQKLVRGDVLVAAGSLETIGSLERAC